MYTAVWTGAESIIFVTLQSIVFLILFSLLLSAYVLYVKKSRYWKTVAVLFIIAVMPFLLGRTLDYSIQVENEQKIIVIRVNNSNKYPVKLLLNNEVITHYGTPDSQYKMVTYVDWLTSRLDIPAYSTKTIYNTDAYASPDRTPIYYTLYGVTLRYPPE